jgi:L-seryl-tRNA(Ser) seleniumtransferase
MPADHADAPDRVAGAIGLRALPQVQRVLERPEAIALTRRFSHAAVAGAVRAELGRLRASLMNGEAAVPDPGAVLASVDASLSAAAQPGLRRVLNATGIVLHTNLGRAPLAPEAIAAAADAARGACNLEFDLQSGRRGARAGGVESLLCGLSGAEAALAVNNNAAAVLLALSALAGDGEVIVSRGELVEIGGGFRIPDIIRQGGACLVEVGSTNKTRIGDYAAAITPRTRVLLKVYQSNFAMVGFTAEAGLTELAELARTRGLRLMDDLGSGTLAELPGGLTRCEPTVAESVAAGSDIVCFSGDKLLGGPQAGLLVGRAAVIDRLRAHPLLRAVRLDKLSLAALEATLRLHADPGTARQRIPVLRVLAQDEAQLQARAERLMAMLAGWIGARIEVSTGHAGGGALPGQAIASRAVVVAAPALSAASLARRLRSQIPALVGRLHDDALWLDMLTLSDDDLPDVVAALRGALA